MPLPEAAELTVQLRRREQAAKASAPSTKDFTRYVVITPDGRTDPLPKRRAIHAVVHAVHSLGVPTEVISNVLPNAKFLSVQGELADEELVEEFVQQYPNARENLKRWFFESPLHESGSTWVLSKMWGRQTERMLDELIEFAPAGTAQVEPVPR